MYKELREMDDLSYLTQTKLHSSTNLSIKGNAVEVSELTGFIEFCGAKWVFSLPVEGNPKCALVPVTYD
jgi:hypothetical protein